MKKLKNIALFTVLLLVLTSTFTTTVYADELVATEETFESEPVEVPYTWIYIQEKPEEQTIREKPHEETFSATEENFGDIDEEENIDNNESDESEEKDYAYRASFVITSDGVTVNETIGDNPSTVTTWDNNDESITKEDIMNDIENFIHNHDDDSESYTPDINLDKGSSYVNDTYNSNHNVENNVVEEEATYGPEEYNPSSIEILNNYDPKNSDDTVFINPEQDHGVYEGINWVYDPIEKKLTFTPGSSTIIPWISKDNYTSLPWMKYKDNVEKISVQDGITSIYANNFRDFTKLTKVYTSGAVNEISSFAFTGCDNIKQFVINCNELNWDFDPALLFNISNDPIFVCNYSTDENSTFHKLYYEGNYTSLKTNQMDTADMDDVAIINQLDDEIKKYHTDNHPGSWTNAACVVSSYSTLVERFAANNEFDSLSGSYDLNTGIELVKEISYTAGPGHVLNSDWFWCYQTYNETYKMFIKNDAPLNVSMKHICSLTKEECAPVSELESKLKLLLKDHPEGIMVYQHFEYGSKSNEHAVIVTDYSNGKYTIWDPSKGIERKVTDYRQISNCYGNDRIYIYTKDIAYIINN